MSKTACEIAFNKLNEMLSELQSELVNREWTNDDADRIDKAYEFRMKLTYAIFDYRKACVDEILNILTENPNA